MGLLGKSKKAVSRPRREAADSKAAAVNLRVSKAYNHWDRETSIIGRRNRKTRTVSGHFLEKTHT